jgi:hypothetical protein
MCPSGLILALSALNYRELAPPIWRRFSRQRRGNGKRGVHKLRNAPSLIGNAYRLHFAVNF